MKMMTTLAAAIAIAGGHAAAQVVLDDDVLSKDGPTWEDSGMVNVPPDCFIAASPTHVGAVDNHALAFYQRSNGALLTGGFVELHDLYGTSSGYDPRIIWDHFESRFVVSSLSSGKLRLTYSDTAVTPIDGNWYPPFEISPIQYDNYTLCGETATLAIDRPSLGFNQDCWMLSAFTFSGNADFINNLFFLVDKEPPVGGDPDDPHNVVTIASQDFVSTRDPEGMLTLGCFSATGLPGAQGREGAHAVRHHDASDALYAVAAASARARPGNTCVCSQSSIRWETNRRSCSWTYPCHATTRRPTSCPTSRAGRSGPPTVASFRPSTGRSAGKAYSSWRTRCTGARSSIRRGSCRRRRSSGTSSR